MKKQRINLDIKKPGDPMENVFKMPIPESDNIKPTDNQVALVQAVFFSTFFGLGIYFYSHDWKLSLFVFIVLFVLISKYEAIREFFREKMMRLFNIR